MKFIKPNVVKNIPNRPIVRTNITQDLSYNDEKIYGLEELNYDNDCQGKWLPWDESNCPDSRDRCTLKFREYKVIKEKKSNGKECTYQGDIIGDGYIEYDYCFGSGHKDRCGLEKNHCDCDLDNYDDDLCDIDQLKEDCSCPAGYKLSEEGKCIQGIPDPETDIATLTVGEKADLEQMYIDFYGPESSSSSSSSSEEDYGDISSEEEEY
jgi:hypothetical protein